jgi:hypothetical protein
MGNYEEFKQAIAQLSGISGLSSDSAIQKLVNERKLVVVIKQARVPDTRKISRRVRGRIMNFVKALFFILYILSTPAICQVQQCLDREGSINDKIIKDFILELTRSDDSFSWRMDDWPCQYKEGTIKMFAATMKADYFKNVAGYEKASINRGENYFDIERFAFSDESIVSRLEKQLGKNKHNRLAVESNTFYCFFREKNDIMLMMTPGRWKNENCALLDRLRERFLKFLF